MPYKVVVPDFRLAAADGLEAGEEANIQLLFGQLAQQASDALGPGRISGAVTKQGLGAHGGCLRLRPFAFFLKALRFFHRGVKVVVQLGLAVRPGHA